MAQDNLTTTDDSTPCSATPESSVRTRGAHAFHAFLPSLIALTYLGCILAGSGYSAMLPAIVRSTNSSLVETSQLTAAVAIASALGKFGYGGWLVDMTGVGFAILFSLSAIAVCAVTTSFSQTFSALLPLVCATEFFFSPLWPAHVQWVRSSKRFSGDASGGIWQLGVASRVGAVISQLLYGWASQLASWRAVEAASALVPLAIIMIAICGYYRLRGRSEERSSLVAAPTNNEAASMPSSSTRSTPVTVPGMLRKMACEPQFWMAAAGNGFLGAVKGTGAMFVGVYFRYSHGPGITVTDGLSMQLAASFNAGIGVSVIVLGACYSSASATVRKALVRTSNAVSCLALIAIAVDAQHVAASWLHVFVRVALFFVSGIGLGLSYYIPPSVFAIHFGGAGAGVVSSFLDGTQYFVSFLVAQLIAIVFSAAESSSWSVVWGLFATCYVVGSCFTSAYLEPLLYTSANRGD